MSRFGDPLRSPKSTEGETGMPYDVITARDLNLLKEWQADVGPQLEALSDVASVRHRKLLALGMLKSEDSLDQVARYVSEMLAAAGDMPEAKAGRDKMAEGLRELTATGRTSQPDGDSDSDSDSPWFGAFSKVYEGADEIRAASLATADKYGKLEDAGRILGQIASAGDVNTLLVLRRDGVPVAMAAVRGLDPGSREIIIADLVAAPAYLAAGGTGTGSVAAEYIIREAKRRNATLSLIALGSKVRAIYEHWGFAGADASMTMNDAAMDTFLTTHKVFETT